MVGRKQDAWWAIECNHAIPANQLIGDDDRYRLIKLAILQ